MADLSTSDRGDTVGPRTREVRLVLAGYGLSSLGDGVMYPFLLIYFHLVRGFGLGVSGLLMSGFALCSFLLSPGAGAVIDRVGPRRVLIGANCAQAVAVAGLVAVRHPWHAVLAGTLFGVGRAGAAPAFDTLVAGMVHGVRRQRVFAWQNILLNIGFGLGALFAVGLVRSDRAAPAGLAIGLLLDAATFAVFAVLLLLAVPEVRTSEPAVGAAVPPTPTRLGGYRQILRDVPFVQLTVLSFLVLLLADQFESVYPAYIVGTVREPLVLVALGSIANVAVVVALQNPVERRADRGRRSLGLALAGALFLVSWLVAAAAWRWPATALGGVLLVLAPGVYALGETLFSPITPALVNDLSPDAQRGRYNAANLMAFQLAYLVGPTFGAGLLGAGLAWLWLAILAAAAAGVLGLAAALGRRLTPAQDYPAGVPEPAVVEAAAVS